jgi:hypothetical protein
MPSWSSDSRFGKNLDEQKRDRDQRSRDVRAEAAGKVTRTVIA